jgi:segregation and condensation protein A
LVDRSPFSRPPLNVLVDPSLVSRKSPWTVNLTELLDLFLQAISKSELIDLRAAGTAILSSAEIYRMKVETLFLFERLRMQHKLADISEPPAMIIMPFRYEVYSTNIDELFEELTYILQQVVLDRDRLKEQNLLPMEDLTPPNIESYVVSLESLRAEFRKILVERLKDTGRVMLTELIKGLKPIDAARVFILLLFAAHNGEVVIEQEEGDTDMLVVSVGQVE